MSVITVEKTAKTKRQEEVAAIVAKHSNKLFGHSNATISEIRLEALRQKLEKIFERNA